jgi:hypothetical protein
VLTQVIPVEGAIAGHDQIMLGLVAVLGTLAGVLVVAIRNGNVVKIAAQQATEANKAVNNVGPGEHRLYDVISRIEAKQDDFDRRWGNLPEEMDDAVGLAELLHEMRREIRETRGELREHVAWEMTMGNKYIPKEN